MIRRLSLLLLLTAQAFAVGAAYSGSTVVNGAGQPIAGASVAVTSTNPCGSAPTYANCNGQAQGQYTGSLPPANLVTLYTDINATTTRANPLTTDGFGNWTAYVAANGTYWVTMYGQNTVPQVSIIAISTASSSLGYTTIQDEGVSLTQRQRLNFTGSAITCSDDGVGTVCTVTGGGGGLTGSLTTNFIPVASGSTTLVDSIISQTTSLSLINVSGGFSATSPNSSSSTTTGSTIKSGNATGSNNSGSMAYQSGTAQSGSSGNVTLQTGNANSGNVGTISLIGGASSSGTGGDIALNPGHGTFDGIVFCSFAFSTDCTFNLANHLGESVAITSGHGAPSGPCEVPKSSTARFGQNTIYLRGDAPSINTLIYGCLISTSTWVPLTFQLPPIAQAVKKTSSTCTPPSSSSYDSCTDTLTWPSTFGDTNYVATCTGVQPLADGGNAATNYAPITIIKSYTATTITVITQQERGAANNFSEIHCIGVHL